MSWVAGVRWFLGGFGWFFAWVGGFLLVGFWGDSLLFLKINSVVTVFFSWWLVLFEWLSDCFVVVKLLGLKITHHLKQTKHEHSSTTQRVLFWGFLMVFWYMKPTKQHPSEGAGTNMFFWIQTDPREQKS